MKLPTKSSVKHWTLKTYVKSFPSIYNYCTPSFITLTHLPKEIARGIPPHWHRIIVWRSQGCWKSCEGGDPHRPWLEGSLWHLCVSVEQAAQKACVPRFLMPCQRLDEHHRRQDHVDYCDLERCSELFRRFYSFWLLIFLWYMSMEFLSRYTHFSDSNSYFGVMTEAFGPFGSLLLQIYIIITNFGCLTIYIIILGDN